MTKRITFLHAADLHLGASFKGLRSLSRSWSERLVTAIPESYARLIDAAIAEQVDFVVIAGDVFDSSRASYADYRCFFKGLDRLGAAGIPVYLCAGNHDPLVSWKREFFALPEHVTMLPAGAPGFALFERAGEPCALIGGRSFGTQAFPANESIASGITRAAAREALGVEAPFFIGVLHTGLDLDPDTAPASPRSLAAAGADYWALGHIHTPRTFPEERPRLAYPGSIQGLDINETGERGAWKVTLSEGAPPALEFVPTASVAWQRFSVDVEDCASVAGVGEKVMRALSHQSAGLRCEELVARIELVGRTPLHRAFSVPGVLEDLRAQVNDAYALFFCDALIDRTAEPLDRAALRAEGLFPAVLMQVAAAQRGNTEGTVAYLQEEFLARGLSLPTAVANEAEGLIGEAESLALELLGGGDAR